ncbi:MAG: cyanoexosortase A system-associated protein [Snowella sp.]|nr:cyanoexosortase A system-associated protein [Snowella sp.]
MSLWDHYRSSVLAIACGGTLLALGWGLKTSLQPRPTVAEMALPKTVPLAGWQQTQSYPLMAEGSALLKPISSRAYQYRHPQGWDLEIQAYYLDASQADIHDFLQTYTTLSSTPQISHQPHIGAIAVLPTPNRVYLSACINPQGPSTVTADQYLRVKLISGKTLSWFKDWLWGRAPLLDQRCLWSHLSIPLRSPSDTKNAQKILEKAWHRWFEWTQTEAFKE